MWKSLKIKKIIYSMGAITTVVVPIFTVLACSYPTETNNLKKLSFNQIKARGTQLIFKSFNKYRKQKTVTPSDILLDYMYQKKKIDNTTQNDLATIQMKTDNSKDIGMEIFVILQGVANDKTGQLTVNILAVTTAHYFYTKKNWPAGFQDIFTSWVINGFKKTSSL